MTLGIFFQPFGDSGLEGIEFALALPRARVLAPAHPDTFLMVLPAHVEMPLDFADGPALGPVEPVQVVDLIGRQHGAFSVIRQKRRWTPAGCCLQDRGREPGGRKCFHNPDLRRKLSCCLQDSAAGRPRARPLRRNALGPKLSCCLQDRAGAVFGPGACCCWRFCARPRRGVLRGTASSNRGCGRAISGGCPGRPGGIPDPPAIFCGDNRRGAAAGSPASPHTAWRAETSKAGKICSQ